MTTTRTSMPSRASFGGALASEWIKARSLRSTWWLAASAVVSTLLVTAFWTAAGPAPTEDNVLDAVAKGFFATEILLILLGAMIATADYEQHAITVFIAAVPRRTPIVLAKVLLAALIGLIVAGATTTLSLALSIALHGVGAALGDPDVSRVLLDLTVFGGAIAVIAACVGLVFRSTIASLGVTLGFFYLAPVIISLIPLDALTLFSDTFPGYAATNFFGTAPDPTRLDPLSGLIATLIWTAAWIVFALVRVNRRNT